VFFAFVTLDQTTFGALVLLGLAADMESGAGEDASDTDLTIAFFLAFFGGIVVVAE
jgi:hypothetical protein